MPRLRLVRRFDRVDRTPYPREVHRLFLNILVLRPKAHRGKMSVSACKHANLRPIHRIGPTEALIRLIQFRWGKAGPRSDLGEPTWDRSPANVVKTLAKKRP